jgi:hypothetical protein
MLLIAKRGSLGFGLVTARHVTKSAGFEKRRNDGATQRASAAGDGYMPITKIHDAKSFAQKLGAKSWPVGSECQITSTS